MKKKDLQQEKFVTRAIHFGEEEDMHQSLNAPIYMSSTFTFKDIQQADDTFSFKRKAYVYTRGGNPTINLFERRMASLEGGMDAVAFASGMSAITTVIVSFAQAGDTVLAHRNLYGSSFSAISQLLPRFGIQTEFLDLTNLDGLKEKLDAKVKVIYFETPSNPSLDIIDIKKIVAIAGKYGAKVVIDNTFATPYFQRPLELGADVVVHSATKYISGHGDAVGGVAIAKQADYIASLKFAYMCELGGVLSPFNAWLFLRGLKTLGIRMQKHEENAKALVDFLSKHSKVAKVIYPGLTQHPNHEIAMQQMSGFGGIVSFELHGDEAMTTKFVGNLKMLKLAVSLGDAESLINVPALMTHRSYPDEELHKFGFTRNTIRISAGLEHHADIIGDLEQALTGI